MEELVVKSKPNLVSVKKYNDSELLVRGTKYLGVVVVDHYSKFKPLIDNNPTLSVARCRALARERFCNKNEIKRLVSHCYNNTPADINNSIGIIFYDEIQDVMKKHLIKCIKSYSSSMSEDECSTMLIDKISNLGEENAAHMILSMEVKK